jgi:serine/threonine protein kinase
MCADAQAAVAGLVRVRMHVLRRVGHVCVHRAQRHAADRVNSSAQCMHHMRVAGALTPQGCRVKMFKRTVKGDIKFPSHFSEECVDLVSKLLVQDPTQRLGMQRRGVQDIKQHAWFAGFDWIAFESRTMAAPYVPVVRLSLHLARVRAQMCACMAASSTSTRHPAQRLCFCRSRARATRATLRRRRARTTPT